jgi:hypothetical protein
MDNGIKKIAGDFCNNHSLVRVVKTNGFYSIGFIVEINDDGIVVENDKSQLKLFISWGLVSEIVQLSKGGENVE